MDDLAQTQLIYVDHYAEETGRSEWATGHKEIPLFHSMTHVPVKPNVWTGSHRLTSVDYFAASNFRNTGLIHSKADHVVFIDDLSVVCPGWWDHVKESKKLKEVYFGTYEKHSEMTVEDGLIVGSIRDLIGVDTRRAQLSANNKAPFYCAGSWLYGCSLAAPIQAFLDINGFDEDCDSMGSEDYIAGIQLQFAGWKTKFCPGMQTIESETHHYAEKPARRVIKPMAGTDASHVILSQVVAGDRRKAAFYHHPYMTLAEARDHVLAGGELATTQIPQHDWRDGQPLTEM